MATISEDVFNHFASKYKEEFCKMLLEHCSEGRSIESFAAVINVLPETLLFWANAHLEFEACLRVAYWKSFYWWEDQVIQDQQRIKELKTLQPGIFSAVMKNRFKWRDNENDLAIAIAAIADKDLEERATRIIEARKLRQIEAKDVNVK